ncbi:rho-related GTP-binding protein RhoN [Halyomorpha halys]|uniref:rho-related GTP-binding protein RhoN n=1 Tax=Halyomorpha halys TaxID=286706 RepID=UPI000D0C85DD|nr:rho-related GTP-binding protein RhoN-like [Halyomorpha halys]
MTNRGGCGAGAYDSVRPLAYQDAHVFLLCFSVADPDSLDNTVNKWYREVKVHCDWDAAVILCGCQVDLRTDKEHLAQMSLLFKSPVTTEQAINVMRQVGATTYVETSAKWSGKAVCDAFEIAALAALGRLNKYTFLEGERLRPAPRSKSKADLKDRARSCSVM